MFAKIQQKAGIKTDKTVSEIFKIPDKVKAYGTIPILDYGITQQADILYLPNDGGFKYLLVVVDFNRIVRTSNLKNLTSDSVIKGFSHIWKSLKIPQRLELDKGVEFTNNNIKAYFEKNKIFVRYAQTGRKSQQGLVERLNYFIGRSIGISQASKEAKSGLGIQITSWRDIVPRVVKGYNEARRETADVEQSRQDTRPVICKSKNGCDILEEGQKVRVKLEEPINFTTGKKEFGTFRAGDQRFEKETRTIDKALIVPGQPVMYAVSGKKWTAYKREELQLVQDDKEDVEDEEDKEDSEDDLLYVVEKLLKRKKINGRIYFLVKWKGYKKPTYSLRSVLKETIPEMIEEFEKHN